MGTVRRLSPPAQQEEPPLKIFQSNSDDQAVGDGSHGETSGTPTEPAASATHTCPGSFQDHCLVPENSPFVRHSFNLGLGSLLDLLEVFAIFLLKTL